MMTQFLILLLPALAVANITINVRGKLGRKPAAGGDKIQFTYSGLERHVISNLERNTFKIDDDNLKNAVKSYFGRRPDNVYVRGPTPWDDLYHKFGWPEVYRSVQPVSVKLVRMETSPKVVKGQISENKSSHKAIFKLLMNEKLENTFTTSWTGGGELDLTAQISFSFDLYFKKTGKWLTTSVNSSWAKTQQTSKHVNIGSKSRLRIPLKPGQSALTQLSATHCMMVVKVEYEASLSGDVAVNYDKTFKDHHFYHFPIDEIMFSTGISNAIRYVEHITLDYYIDTWTVQRSYNAN